MKKGKRILALAGVILLAAMYLATLIFALIGTPWAFDLFKICIGMTIIIPVLLYGYIMIYKILSGKNDDEPKKPDESN